MRRTFHVLYLWLYFRKEKYSILREELQVKLELGNESSVTWRNITFTAKSLDLQDIVEKLISSEDLLAIYQKGKYADIVWVYCYKLLSLNVGVQKVKAVITNVLRNII